jgi:hypothetical protein
VATGLTAERQALVDGGWWLVDGGWWTVDGGRWMVDGGWWPWLAAGLLAAHLVPVTGGWCWPYGQAVLP